MPYNCEFCNSKLKTKSSLIRHQKTAKKCLQIRLENKSEKKCCPHCNKLFVTEFHFNSHSCKISKNEMDQMKKDMKREIDDSKNIINEYKSRIKELEDKLINTKTVINNITNNNKSFNTKNKAEVNIQSDLITDKDKIKKFFDDNYKPELYNVGFNKIMKFIVNSCLKDDDKNLVYIPVDVARKKFCYKNKGELVYENNAGSIVENYTKPLTKYNKQFEKLNVDEIRNQISELEELSSELSNVNDMLNLEMKKLNKKKEEREKKERDKKRKNKNEENNDENNDENGDEIEINFRIKDNISRQKDVDIDIKDLEDKLTERSSRLSKINNQLISETTVSKEIIKLIKPGDKGNKIESCDKSIYEKKEKNEEN